MNFEFVSVWIEYVHGIAFASVLLPHHNFVFFDYRQQFMEARLVGAKRNVRVIICGLDSIAKRQAQPCPTCFEINTSFPRVNDSETEKIAVKIEGCV